MTPHQQLTENAWALRKAWIELMLQMLEVRQRCDDQRLLKACRKVPRTQKAIDELLSELRLVRSETVGPTISD